MTWFAIALAFVAGFFWGAVLLAHLYAKALDQQGISVDLRGRVTARLPVEGPGPEPRDSSAEWTAWVPTPEGWVPVAGSVSGDDAVVAYSWPEGES